MSVMLMRFYEYMTQINYILKFNKWYSLLLKQKIDNTCDDIPYLMLYVLIMCNLRIFHR